MVKAKNKKGLNLLVIAFALVIIIAIAGLVIAQSQEDLEQELAQLIDELTNSGYDWLVDYSGELPVIEPAEIEVYTENNNTLITKFTNISDEGWYKIFLTELVGSYSVFDLKIIGFAVEFDYIVDPTITITESQIVDDSLLTNVTAEKGDANFTHLNISTTAPYDSLVGYWSFDGDNVNSKGNTSYDFSKENNDGTMGGDAVVNSTGCLTDYGDCLQLDGDGDYVDLTDLDLVSNFTVSLWIKVSGIGDAEIIIGDYDTQTGDEGWAIGFVGTDDLYFRHGGGGGYENQLVGDTNSDDGLWHNVVAVVNDTGVDVYYDNTKYTIVFDAGKPIGNSGYNVFIGASPRITQFFNGTIDEVMIFNTSLTAAQISDIYNNQSARFVTQGTQKVRAVNITDTSNWQDAGYNRVNLTATFERNMDSNISARIGQFNISVDPDGLVGYWPFEWGSAVDISGHCYDNETEILTDEGWKYFYELTGDEKVMTLNQETGEREWQMPTAWQEFDNNGEMYKIKTEKGDLIVSEKHKVYVKRLNVNGLVENNKLYLVLPLVLLVLLIPIIRKNKCLREEKYQ